MRVSPLGSHGQLVGTPVEVHDLRKSFFIPIDRSAAFSGIRMGDWVATREGVQRRPVAEVQLSTQLFADEGTITIITTWFVP